MSVWSRVRPVVPPCTSALETEADVRLLSVSPLQRFSVLVIGAKYYTFDPP
jgi:hypothetical protein